MQTPHRFEVGRSGGGLYDAGNQEKRGLGQDVGHHIKQGTGQCLRRKQADTQNQIADLTDDVVGQNALHVHLGQRPKNAQQHGQNSQNQQQFMGQSRVMAEDQRKGAEDGIHADLGQNPAKECAQPRGRLEIRSGQPEIERKDGRLGAEHKQEDQGQNRQRRVHLPGHGLNFIGQVGHIEGAHRPVQHRQADEKKG